MVLSNKSELNPGESDSSSVSSDTVSRELEKTRFEVLKLSTSDLERDIAEIKNEINFLEAQVSYDLTSYSPEALERAGSRIQLLKLRAKIMMGEYERRKK
jgi:hypothetical protein